MSHRLLALALTLGLACGGHAAAAPLQTSGALARGGSYVISPDARASTASLALWFRAPSDGYDGTTPGIGQLAAATCAAVRLSGGKSLVDLVRSLGGRLVLGGEPDMVSIDVIVPAGSARRVLAAMSSAYFAAAPDAAAFALALRDSAVRGVERRYSPELAMHDAMLAQMLASGPAHVAVLPGTADAYTAIPLEGVAAFAKRAFASPNAYLALAGAVDASMLDTITDGDPSAIATAVPIDSLLGPAGTSATLPAAVAGLAYGFAGPPIRDERAATALDFISDYLFDPDNGVVSLQLRDTAADVTGHFLTFHDPGLTVVSISGGDLELAGAKVRAAIGGMATPLDTATFAAARRAFAYRSASNASTPAELADGLAWYALQGNEQYAPGDASGTYAASIASLDPAFVASIARRYLQTPTVVHLTAEKGSSS